MSTLIAGLGNVFFSDDGFGVEVAQRLARRSRPSGVRVVDVGIRGLHLAYELLAAVDLLVVVDAVTRGAKPGTLFVIDPASWADAIPSEARPASADAHGLELDAVFRMLRALGGQLPRTRIVGCEPQSVDEGMGLTERVRAAIVPAVELVERIVVEHRQAEDGGGT